VEEGETERGGEGKGFHFHLPWKRKKKGACPRKKGGGALVLGGRRGKGFSWLGCSERTLLLEGKEGGRNPLGRGTEL